MGTIIADYENLSAQLSKLFQDENSDAILAVDGEEMLVHRCILAARSEFFQLVFDDSENDKSELEKRFPKLTGTGPLYNLNIDDVIVPCTKEVRLEVFRSMMKYIYSGANELPDDVQIILLGIELAHQFSLNVLQGMLSEHLLCEMDSENFVDFYNVRTRYQNAVMVDPCIDFMMKNGEEISKSDSFTRFTLDSLKCLLDLDNFAASEIDVFRAVERWAKVNKPDSETCDAILKKIRFATISKEDLSNIVAVSEVIPSIDITRAIQSIENKDEASTNFRQLPCIKDDELSISQCNMKLKLLSGCTSHRVGGVLVQLEGSYLLNGMRVLLDSSEGRSYRYHIEVSNDGKDWQRVVDHSNHWCRSHQFLRFDSKAVRFIKITGVNCVELKIISLEAIYTSSEINLLEGLQETPSNVVLESRGAIVTGGKSPMRSINGNGGAYALLRENHPLTITLGQPYWLSSCRIRINAGGTSYSIESSPDGDAWESVCDDVKGLKGTVWKVFEFNRRVVVHFRVKMKKLEYHCISLYHFESPSSTIIPVTN